MKTYYIASGYTIKKDEADVVLFNVDNGCIKILNQYFFGNNPSFVQWHRKLLYVCFEKNDGAKISAFSLNSHTLELEEKASIEFNGCGACHFMIFNHLIYVSCYYSGNLFVISEDLSEVIQKIEGEPGKSHFHWSDVDKKNELLFVSDLGKDEILVFSLKNRKKLVLAYKIKCSEGSGPRQVKVMLPGQLLVVNENDNLWKYIKYTLHGICKEGPDIVCSMKTSSNYPSMAAVYGEKLLCVANRGSQTISVFSAQTMQFVFEDKCYCEWPRYMYIDSYNYLWVTGQKSNEVVCLKLSENNKKMLFKQAILLQGASCIVEIEGEKKEVW